MHTVGTGSDVKQVWLLALTAAMRRRRDRRRLGAGRLRLAGAAGACAATAVAASVVLPAALVLWLPSGPLGADWAARAGTPTAVLAQTSGTATSGTATTSANGSGASSPAPVSGFQGAVTGTVTQSANGAGEVTVNIALDVQSSTLSQLAIQIDGSQEAGGGVR